jgi:hypothetical protein
MRRVRHSAFSLVEVVLAVGIFAVAVATMLALLPALTRQTAESADALVAQELPDNLRVELQRLAAQNFNELAAAVPVMTAPLDNGLLFVASRDGGRLHSFNYRPPAVGSQIPTGEQYFAVEVWRFSQKPLAYDPAGSVLPLYVRVSGPYRLPAAATVTSLGDRSQITFTLVIAR